MCLLGTMSLGAVAVAVLILLPWLFTEKGKWAAVTLTLITGLVCLADIFCQEYFLSPLSAGIVRLVKNTDTGEVAGFVSSFLAPSILGRWRISASLALLIATPFAARLKLPSFLLPLVLVPGIVGLWHLGNTPPGRLVTAIVQMKKQDREKEARRTAYLTARADTCTFRSSRIVLVIGESFNKHHASAYGYRLPTTPFLDAHKADTALVLFTDAVSPRNMTSAVFEQLFAVPFPAILKRAGFTVNGYSNQHPLAEGIDRFTAGGNLFSDRTLNDVSFSYRNREIYPFDEAFLEAELPAVPSAAPVLDIIHLKGQHFDYEKHYPPEWAFFTMDNYPVGTREEVMHYDNATRYHDAVLEKIRHYYSDTDAIVIFLSDHGEEVFDELPISGRSHAKPGPAEARAEYEVPMWIWYSDAYGKNHPDVVKALPEAAHRPFYTPDVAHLILDLAGAVGPFTKEENSVLRPAYVCPPRILAGEVDYDKLFP